MPTCHSAPDADEPPIQHALHEFFRSMQVANVHMCGPGAGHTKSPDEVAAEHAQANAKQAQQDEQQYLAQRISKQAMWCLKNMFPPQFASFRTRIKYQHTSHTHMLQVKMCEAGTWITIADGTCFTPRMCT